MSKFPSNSKGFCVSVCGLLLYKKNRRDSLSLPVLFLFWFLCGQELKEWIEQLKEGQWAKQILVDQLLTEAMISLGRTHTWLSLSETLAHLEISLCYYDYWMSMGHKEWAEKALGT